MVVAVGSTAVGEERPTARRGRRAPEHLAGNGLQPDHEMQGRHLEAALFARACDRPMVCGGRDAECRGGHRRDGVMTHVLPSEDVG
jgi:hypothetical protein